MGRYAAFPPGGARWNENFIHWYVLWFSARVDGRTTERTLTFDAAARTVGTTGGALRTWMFRLERLGVYCLSSDESYVEISLDGSAGGLFGLRYVDSEGPDVDEWLQEGVRRQGVAEGDHEFQHIQGRWYYFLQ